MRMLIVAAVFALAACGGRDPAAPQPDVAQFFTVTPDAVICTSTEDENGASVPGYSTWTKYCSWACVSADGINYTSYGIAWWKAPADTEWQVHIFDFNKGSCL